jgi:ribosomal protein S24E
MAKVAAQDIIYFITFIGIYFNAKTPGENACNYEIEVPISHEQLMRTYTVRIPVSPTNKNDLPYKEKKIIADSPLSLFRRDYAPIVMPNKYPDYQALQTFEIKSVRSTHPEMLKENIALMNFQKLTEYIGERELEIEPALYDDAGSLRAAIQQYKTDKEGFLSIQEQTHKRKGKKVVQTNIAKTMLDKYSSQLQNAVKTNGNGKKVKHGRVNNGYGETLDQYENYLDDI